MSFLPGTGMPMPDDGQHLHSGMNPLSAGGIGGFQSHEMAMAPVNGSPAAVISPSPSSVAGRSVEERQLAQWGYHETKELISLRAELEKDFIQTKGNSKTMWEILSAQMKERGYRRTPAQCKTKWKVLVNRYKGKEVSEDADKMFPPFYEELDAIFKERAKNMDRLLLESEVAGQGQTGDMGMPVQLKAKPIKRTRSEDENTDEDEEGEEGEEGEDGEGGTGTKRRKLTRKAQMERKNAHTIQEVLEQFFLQQLKLEQEWREAIERREAERRLREREWRERMEALEKERMAREEAWRKREEERRTREEQRAERRDQLIAALLAKLA